MTILAIGITSCSDQESIYTTASSSSSDIQTTTTDTQTGSNYPADWVKHDPEGNTKCSDGSSFSFFSRDAAKDKVMLFFQGGGACWDILTCNSLKSRNTYFGYIIGSQPKISIEDHLKSQETTEGYFTVKAVYEIANEKKVDMPIMKSVYNILHKGASIESEINILLNRSPKDEFY